MEKFVTKQEGKLYKALQSLLANCVDGIGLPKKPTVKQLRKAQETLHNYEHYERLVNKRMV